VSWASMFGGDWDTAGNWSTGLVPTAGDDVSIPQSGITITHNTTANDAVNSLTSTANIALSFGSLSLATAGVSSAIDATLTVSGGTLTASGNLTIGTLNLSGGTLAGSGTLTVTNAASWTGGTMSGTGNTTIPTGVTLTISGSGSDFLNQRTLNLVGT